MNNLRMETENIEIISFQTIIVQNWADYLFVQNNENINIIIDFQISINPNNSDDFGDVLRFKNCIFNFEVNIENIENPK